MLLLVVIAVLALVFLGLGIAVIHWLLIVAAILALIWLISLFTGGIGRRGGARL